MYNILLSGAAGDGIETMSSLLEKLLKKSGYHVFTTHDFMSRVRGGHNFVQIRFGSEPIESHCDTLDGIFAINSESYSLHLPDLKPDGFVICDTSIPIDDVRGLVLPLKDIAREVGNSKVITSVAIGAILALFGIDTKDCKEILEHNLKASLVDVNFEAIQKGNILTEARFHGATTDLSNHILLSGTNATTLGAIAAGLKFYAAYPMSPSTDILEFLEEHGAGLDIVVEQAEDEIAAINMAIGAAYAGAPAMTGTSGGGFSLMVEALGFAGIAEIPIVVENVQRPGPATGLPTRTEQSDLKFVISASQGEFPRMVIALRNHTDAFYQTYRAFAIAKKYQMPVLILSDQHIGDATATIPMYDLKGFGNKEETFVVEEPYKSYKLTENGISPRLFPGQSKHLVHVDSDEHDEFGFITEDADVRIAMMDKRLGKLKLLEADLIEPEFIGDEACETLFVGFGSTYGSIKEAVHMLNKQGGSYGALIFGDVYPLPTKLLKDYANKVQKIVSIEQNATAQLASLICEVTAIVCQQHILKYDGRQMTADFIVKRFETSKEVQ